MRYLKGFSSFINEGKFDSLLLEALESNIAKFYLEINSAKRDKRLKEIWAKLLQLGSFSKKEGDRIYFESFEMDTQDIIEDFLDFEGYDVTDYKNNKAYDRRNNRWDVKITKILSNLSKTSDYALNLLKEYNNEASKGIIDRGRKVDSSQYIVFSKDKLDIAKMSTDRKWTSCTNLYDGGNRDYVSTDIIEGTFIAYLIDNTDIEIENPDARVLIKPYQDISKEDDIYYFTEDKVYGQAPTGFLRTINTIIEQVQEFQKPVQLKLIDTLYCDNEAYKKRLEGVPKNISPEESLKIYLDYLNLTNYKINDDLSIDVDGDVDISQKNLTKIPIKFGKVAGNFICNGNILTNLVNSPKEVGGSFVCDSNHLKSLHNSPRIVNGDFYANNNEIETLRGCPEFIGGIFSMYGNKLKQIDFYPKTVVGGLDLSYNLYLKSLEGLPNRVSYSITTFACGELKSLKGSPEYVGGDFICEGNSIKSLEYAPKYVGRNFNCSRNLITSLENGPSVVKGDYDCRHNKNLFSLKGAPEEIEGNFNISFSYDLETFENAPKKVGKWFVAKQCYLISDEEIERLKETTKAGKFIFD